jgi:hypothetical protein
MRDETAGEEEAREPREPRESRELRDDVLRAVARAASAIEREATLGSGSDASPRFSPGPEIDRRLRSAVVAYTRAMHRSGLPPERVVVLVKQLLREAGSGVEPADRRALAERATRWCIAAYFEDTHADAPDGRDAGGAHGH